MSAVRSIVRTTSRTLSIRSAISTKSSPQSLILEDGGGGAGVEAERGQSSSAAAAAAVGKRQSVSWRLPDSNSSYYYNNDWSASIVNIPEELDEQPKRPYTKKTTSSDFIEWKHLHLSYAKLKGVSDVAFILAEFGCFMAIEIAINDGANPILLAAFTTVFSLNIIAALTASMIARYLLPEMEMIVELYPGAKPSESPHIRHKLCVHVSWVLVNTVSIFLFTLGCILVCWIKFSGFSVAAAWCGTAILFPVLLAICLFGILFYRSLNRHQVLMFEKQYRELKMLSRQLNNDTRV